MNFFKKSIIFFVSFLLVVSVSSVNLVKPSFGLVKPTSVKAASLGTVTLIPEKTRLNVSYLGQTAYVKLQGCAKDAYGNPLNDSHILIYDSTSSTNMGNNTTSEAWTFSNGNWYINAAMVCYASNWLFAVAVDDSNNVIAVSRPMLVWESVRR